MLGTGATKPLDLDTSDRACHRDLAAQRITTANIAWDRRHGPADADAYRRDILPTLATIPLRRLQEATQLSKTTCGQIRRGLKVPHPRHWGALQELSSQPGI